MKPSLTSAFSVKANRPGNVWIDFISWACTNTNTNMINGATLTAIFIEEQSYLEKFVFFDMSHRAHMLLRLHFFSLHQFCCFPSEGNAIAWHIGILFLKYYNPISQTERRRSASEPRNVSLCMRSNSTLAQNTSAVFFFGVFDIGVSLLSLRHS